MESAFEKMESALDRFQEAHFWLHKMEEHYHSADLFRWHLNAFLKAMKEVPDMVSMSLQNEPGFTSWFRAKRKVIENDELMRFLATRRDQIVHRSMLVPESRAAVGVTEGRGMKLGLSLPVSPLADSDEAMRRYLWSVKTADRDDEMKDFLGILVEDEDSLPCVEREWKLKGFDDELIDLCSKAWLMLAEVLRDCLKWLGLEVPPQTLSCRNSHQAVRFKTYSREKLKAWVAKMPSPSNAKKPAHPSGHAS